MTTNRLAKSETKKTGSVFTASEWAAIAEEKGLKTLAEDWRKAAREGWDTLNYDPKAAAAHKRKIDENRRKWGGWPLYSDEAKRAPEDR